MLNMAMLTAAQQQQQQQQVAAQVERVKKSGDNYSLIFLQIVPMLWQKVLSNMAWILPLIIFFVKTLLFIKLIQEFIRSILIFWNILEAMLIFCQ